MTAGLASATATAVINVLRGTSYTGLAGLFIKLHTGDPGSAGTANPSAVTTRNALTLNPPSVVGSNMVATMASLASYAMTATESITHVTAWDTSGPAGGTFVGSGPLSSAKSVNNGDTLTFDSLAVSLGPLAS